MSDIYIEFRKNQNIKPVVLPNKRKYYMDLMNIEHSWSGRMDILWGTSNTFIMEAVQLIVNSMELFEKGYFDCAFYSLREAIEISTTNIYLSDMPEDVRQKRIKDWKTSAGFPLQHHIVAQLSQDGEIFADMKQKMFAFFDKAKTLNTEINKIVHKQGFEYFYVSRNFPLSQSSSDKLIENYVNYLKQCIGIVAVMRLALDPFPVLLIDEEILFRCFNSITVPYSEEFTDEYIGEDTLAAYKTTEIYTNTYESFIRNERKTLAVYNVTNNQYIDSTKMDEILQQLHLMTKDDILCVSIVFACNKVVKVYCCGGMMMYFTEKNTNRKAMSYSSLEFERFAEAEDKINQVYDGAYISVFFADGEPYFVEHNTLLSNDDIANIGGMINVALLKMHEEQ